MRRRRRLISGWRLLPGGHDFIVVLEASTSKRDGSGVPYPLKGRGRGMALCGNSKGKKAQPSMDQEKGRGWSKKRRTSSSRGGFGVGHCCSRGFFGVGKRHRNEYMPNCYLTIPTSAGKNHIMLQTVPFRN